MKGAKNMSNKKIFSIFLLIFVSVLVFGDASAATTSVTARRTIPAPVKYTTAQQTCISSNLRTATKPAQDIFSAATKSASAIRQTAVIAAQKLTDLTARAAAIKAANDVFNNDPAVKQARAPYMSALTTARTSAIATCTGTTVSGTTFLDTLKNIFQKSTSALLNSVVTQKPAGTSTSTSAPVKYTVAEQACMNSKQQGAIKPALDALNAATKSQLATKQAAIKIATDALNAATKSQLATKQAAIIAAQKLTDLTARAAAIKAANDAYNNNSTVKQAKVPYSAAIKAANDVYNNDPAVKQAKVPYMTALISARNNAIAACAGATTTTGSQTVVASQNGSKSVSIWQAIVNFFSSLFGGSK